MSATLRPIVPKEQKNARVAELKRPSLPRRKASPDRRAAKARIQEGRPRPARGTGAKRPERIAGRAGAARPPAATIRQRFWRSSKALSAAWISVLIVLIIPALMQMYHQSVKLEALQAQVSELSAQKAALEESITALQTELSSVNTDAFIEKYAHEKLGMVKKNELVVEIDGNASSEETSSDAESVASSEQAPSEGKSGQ